MKNKKAIDWLEIISASDSRRAGMRTSLCTVDTGNRTCYGVRVDEQWVVGQEVAVLFDTPEAASRFLSMVGVEAYSTDKEENVSEIECRNSRQCFHVSSMGGLGTCPHKGGFPAQGDRPANDARYFTCET